MKRESLACRDVHILIFYVPLLMNRKRYTYFLYVIYRKSTAQ